MPTRRRLVRQLPAALTVLTILLVALDFSLIKLVLANVAFAVFCGVYALFRTVSEAEIKPGWAERPPDAGLKVPPRIG